MGAISRTVATGRAIANTVVCLLKVFPMLPSWPVDWLTPRPVVERLRYPTTHGEAEGDLYRPSTRGPHPGVVVCLGVVPLGVDHPQVPRLGLALARSGFAALLYWSPAMRDFRLDPADVDDIASAYETLLARPDIDATRSGLLGTCVGGAFALMAATMAKIRERVSFVSAYAPYASMWNLAADIASASRCRNGSREPWAVDPLARKVYVHSVTALLEPLEAQPLLSAQDARAALEALHSLPATLRERLNALSPTTYLADLRAGLVVLLHDRDDPVIPVSESRYLRDELLRLGRDVRYTEFTVFQHLDPTRGNPSPPALARELIRFGRAMLSALRRSATMPGECVSSPTGVAI